MGVRPVGQGSPKGRPRSGGRGNDFVGPQRSEGEAKWWDPTVLDAPVARPSEWDNREQVPFQKFTLSRSRMQRSVLEGDVII